MIHLDPIYVSFVGECESSVSQEENIAKVVGTTSSEGFSSALC